MVKTAFGCHNLVYKVQIKLTGSKRGFFFTQRPHDGQRCRGQRAFHFQQFYVGTLFRDPVVNSSDVKHSERARRLTALGGVRNDMCGDGGQNGHVLSVCC